MLVAAVRAAADVTDGVNDVRLGRQRGLPTLPARSPAGAIIQDPLSGRGVFALGTNTPPTP
jgi:hypothetical protein